MYNLSKIVKPFSQLLLQTDHAFYFSLSDSLKLIVILCIFLSSKTDNYILFYSIMAQRFVNNFLKKHLSNVTDYDRMFTRQVLNDIGKFVYNEDYLENE